MATLNVNGKRLSFDAEPDTPLLWVLREQLGLTGTKYGCGVAQCGACTVHIDGVPTRSCVRPVSSRAAPSEKIVTIEGLSPDGDAPGAEGLGRARRAAVRLLPVRHDHGRRRAAARTSPSPTDADIDAGDDQHLPLRHLQPRARRHQGGGRGRRHEAAGAATSSTSTGARHERRHVVSPRASSAAAPARWSSASTSPSPARAGAGRSAPEVNAWVVIQPDDTVVIRIARSEMGQGTLTGLAQLVAEELECDWAKVTTEYPTPGQNLARNRVWGNFSTGGSRGIRESHDYVRKGGATARMMLVQAAADEWKVPAAECTRRRQRDHAHAQRAADHATARWPPPPPS